MDQAIADHGIGIAQVFRLKENAVTHVSCNPKPGLTTVMFYRFSYVWSGFIVLLGIFLNVYSKNEAVVNAWFVAQRNKYTIFFSSRQKSRTPLMEMV